MKKITFFLLIFVLAYAKTYSQKEAYNWNFGIGAALTFNTSDIEPVFVPNSKLSNWEGCTTMSDENGNLLFYSNGSSIWNKENNIMDNGSGLHGNNSATHSCVSFKKPGSTNQYYIFTVDAVESQRFGFNYSIIDISLNGGLGKVIQKNINVHPKPVEKLLVIPHSNQIDYWVIVHLWENNEYLAYLVDNNGVNSTPVVSHGTILSPRSTGHAIKASQDGKKIASAHSFAKVIELYDFDATTGKMTLTHNLQHPYFDWPYGVEFSPNKTRLYASLFSPCRLVQLDLTQNSENAIVNSMVELGYHKTATFYYGSLQLAPNGKMYVAKDGTSTLGVIKKPNELGNDCEYSDIGFNLLNGSKSGLGLPTFVQTFIYPQIFCIVKGEELIPNGSFDNDFDGFYSQYYFIKNPPMNMNGAYTITNNPSAYFSGWMKFDDKSPSSNGKMFLADAGSNTKDVLIGTNVPVKKNTYYQFSCWVASVHNVVPPLIKVVINDQFQIAKQVPAKGGEWVNILFEWNSSNFDNAKIELFDDNPSLYGNDFVIDEISLKECFPENSDIRAKTIVYIDSAKANTGDTTTLHLILRHSENMRESGITGYQAQFRYNVTLLFPVFQFDNDSIFDNERIMQISNTLPDNFTNDNFILKEMKFVAALGNSECTLMKLDTVIWLGGPYDIIQEDGNFCLKNVCYEGGARLLNPNNKVELLQISPNPNDGNLAVELNLIEEGSSTLSIYNSNGQLMYEQNLSGSTGKIDLNIDTKQYGNGLYFVSLQTPTIRKVKQLVVFK